VTDHREQIDELRRRARQAGEGAAQVALLEEAARLADGLGDAGLGAGTVK